MLIVLVGAFHVGDGVVRAKASQRVYMAVGIIACQVSVVKPQHLLKVESLFQILFDIASAHGIVSVGGE